MMSVGAAASSSAAPAKIPPACSASQLNGVGGRQGESMGAAGELILVNVSATSCRLSGVPRLTLYREGSPGPTGNVLTSSLPSNPVTPVVIKPNGLAALTTYWGNWCGPAVKKLKVIVTLPSRRNGEFAVPFNGPPDYNAMPQCVNRSVSSFFEVTGGYHLVTGQLPNCVMSNFTASLGRGSAAAGTSYEEIALVNRGPVCTLVRIEARGYDSKSLSFVGPWAKYLPNDASRLHMMRVGIISHNGRGHVSLGVETPANFSPSSRCMIANTNEVRLAEISSLAKSIPLVLAGPTQVCTKIQTLLMDWPGIDR